MFTQTLARYSPALLIVSNVHHHIASLGKVHLSVYPVQLVCMQVYVWLIILPSFLSLQTSRVWWW